jgi:hypothetical protein
VRVRSPREFVTGPLFTPPSITTDEPGTNRGTLIGGPMTYMLKGKQYIVVPVGSRNEPAEYVALALP